MALGPNSNAAVADDAAQEMTAQLRRLAAAAAAVSGDDPVAYAEGGTGRSSRDEFSAWMYEECERLEAARQDAIRQGLPRRRTVRCFAPPTTSREKPPPSAIQLWLAPRTACAGCSSTPRN